MPEKCEASTAMYPQNSSNFVVANCSPPPASQLEAGLHGGAVPEGSRGLSASDTPGTIARNPAPRRGARTARPSLP